VHFREDGSIERGAQNLPGNWESSKFNLPKSVREAVPAIGDHETMVVMHKWRHLRRIVIVWIELCACQRIGRVFRPARLVPAPTAVERF
jgi:hypothetical protein